MARVSVLIPAFKPEYLVQAVVSALQQTFSDIEILIGDDTPDARLEQVVAQITDPRVAYHHHGYGDGELNLKQLWQSASGMYIKPLFDDDLLLPSSIEVLVNAMDSNPNTALAFHERVYVGTSNEIVRTPPQLLQPGSVARLSRQAIANLMLPTLDNRIGEPTNTMLNRELVDVEDAYMYRGRKLQFLADVASYLNLSTEAPVVGVGGYFSAFRQHGAQNSNTNSPRISAGLFEWELLVRGEAAAGNLTGRELRSAWRTLRVFYAPYLRRLPEIAQFSAHLDEIAGDDSSALLSARFEADLQTASEAVDARLDIARHHAEPQNHCAICEQQVGDWLPGPGGTDATFMDQLGVVGSQRPDRLCPACGCSENDRHLWLNLQAAGLIADVPDMRILHVAPEPAISSKLVGLEPFEYVRREITAVDGRTGVDVEAMPFDSGYFDLIICNHVLEAVEFPARVLAEICRCLRDGGQLIAQTRYAPILKHTLETTTVDAEDFASHYLGDARSARLFGIDIIDTFHAAGLLGAPIPHTSLLGSVEPATHGVDPRESFFLFRRSLTDRLNATSQASGEHQARSGEVDR